MKNYRDEAFCPSLPHENRCIHGVSMVMISLRELVGSDQSSQKTFKKPTQVADSRQQT